MNLFNQAELKAGADRYGARENAQESKCIKCGESFPVDEMVDNEHGAGKLCKADAKDWNLDNAVGRCSCGGAIEKVPGHGDEKPEYECDDCGKIYQRDDQGRSLVENTGLGYQTTTTSTTAKSKRKIAQKFYTVGRNDLPNSCDGGCGKTFALNDKALKDGRQSYCIPCAGILSSLENMSCPACGEACLNIRHCVEHLMGDHDMTEAQAESVLGAQVNAADKTCPHCGDDVYEDTKDGKKRCSRCSEVYNAANVYVPPLLTVAQRVAIGQKQYGAKNDAYPNSYFKHQPAKGRAEEFGLIDVEDDDLTDEGLEAKRKEKKEAHDD